MSIVTHLEDLKSPLGLENFACKFPWIRNLKLIHDTSFHIPTDTENVFVHTMHFKCQAIILITTSTVMLYQDFVWRNFDFIPCSKPGYQGGWCILSTLVFATMHQCDCKLHNILEFPFNPTNNLSRNICVNLNTGTYYNQRDQK